MIIKGGTAPVQYIIFERDKEAYRIEYDGTPLAIVTNDIDKMQMHCNTN